MEHVSRKRCAASTVASVSKQTCPVTATVSSATVSTAPVRTSIPWKAKTKAAQHKQLHATAKVVLKRVTQTKVSKVAKLKVAKAKAATARSIKQKFVRNQHGKYCTDIKLYWCGHCEDTSFVLQRQLKSHLHEFHGLRVCGYSHCFVACASLAALQFHQDSHCSGQFSCDKCPASFSLKHQLVAHSLLHTDVKEFKCDTCGKKYKRKSDLTARTKSHVAALFACPSCNHKAVSKRKLGYHMCCHKIASLKCHVSDAFGKVFKHPEQCRYNEKKCSL